ncbi:hypothetical protein IV203_005429 [Nitzschia inconspicua]|uniref:Transmembrane protein n=1 Tax=Nitzschia inconspicua TaxID=303405 RepID=A0A9K3PGX9_9STRA|nr:hypothetical protein IV203_005429 [Nitzschia inconspicua]
MTFTWLTRHHSSWLLLVLTAAAVVSCVTVFAIQGAASQCKRLQVDEPLAMSASAVPSQTPSVGVTRIMALSLFTNGHVSVTSTPTSAPTVTMIASGVVPIQLNGTTTPSLALTSTDSSLDSQGSVMARIPEITIGVKIQEPTIITTNVQPLLVDFFQDFVDNLIRASDWISSSAFQHSELDVSLIKMASYNPYFNLGIVLNGAALVLVDSAWIDDDAFRNSIQKSMVSYLSFWGTSELEAELGLVGLQEVKVMSISVDGVEEQLYESLAHGIGTVDGQNDVVDQSAAYCCVPWDTWIRTPSVLPFITGLLALIIVYY